MRIVFDTNVLLSGVFTRGVCEILLDECLVSDEHTVVASEHILGEFARHAEHTFGAPRDEAQLAVQYMRAHVELVDPETLPADACRDSEDLPILGTLLAAKADCLVTGDADLLDLREFRGAPILSPRQLHDRLA